MDSYISNHLDLLTLEHETELNELKYQLDNESAIKCEALGLSILNLEITSIFTSMFGRITFELKYSLKKSLPSSCRVGDEVEVISSNKIILIGIVTKLLIYSIEITVDSIEDTDDILSPVRINKRVSEVTYKKLCSSLQNISQAFTSCHPIVTYVFNTLFNNKNDVIYPPSDRIKRKIIKGSVQGLNESQISAIEHSMHPNSIISLIHGPPGESSPDISIIHCLSVFLIRIYLLGTGKTSTLTDLLLQLVKSNNRVLVCAPSNIAVDNLLDRFIHLPAAKGISCLRLGHPARIDSDLLAYSLDSKLSKFDGKEIIEDIKKEMKLILQFHRSNKRFSSELKSNKVSLRVL